jgi:hypothetical protein
MRAASRSISTFLCPVTPTPISLTIEVTPQTKTPQTLDALYGALSDTPMPEIAIDPLP